MADAVVFAGFRPDARDLYALFDLFVLNSSDEPYGLAILEAAEAGVAVVATATEGAKAIAEQLPIQLIPIGSPEALAAAIRRGATRAVSPRAIAGHGIAERLSELRAFYDRVLAIRGRHKSRSVVRGESRCPVAPEGGGHEPVQPP
jgi:glycosyltransferase involved in cell wall biosynthesis